MVVKFNSNDLKAAVKKMKGFAGETFVLILTEKEMDGKLTAKLEASNGTAQAMVKLPYESDKPMKDVYYLGTEFSGVIDTLSAFGDVIELEKIEEFLKVTCGTAILPVPLQKDAMRIKLENFKENEDAVRLIMSRQDLLSLITQGGFAFSDVKEQVNLYQTIYLLPEVSGDERMIRVFSSNLFVVASAVADCEVRTDDTFTAWAKEGRGTLVKAPALLSLVRRLTEEKIIVYLSKKQLCLRDGDDAYCFICIAEKMPNAVIKSIKERVAPQYNFLVQKTALKAAANVSGLFNKDGKIKLTRSEEDGNLSISNYAGDGVAVVETGGVGSVDLKVNILFLMKATDVLLSDEIRMSGLSDSKTGIYLSSVSENAVVLLMPCN